jgi:hypothetical protein
VAAVAGHATKLVAYWKCEGRGGSRGLRLLRVQFVSTADVKRLSLFRHYLVRPVE